MFYKPMKDVATINKRGDTWTIDLQESGNDTAYMITKKFSNKDNAIKYVELNYKGYSIKVNEPRH